MADYKRISHFRASPFDFDLNPENPRLCGREFNPDDVSHLGDLSGMARSIAEFGVRLPIAVRKVGDRFQVVDGDCRIQACRMVATYDDLLAIWNSKTDNKPVEIDAFAVPIDFTAEEIDEASVMLNCQRSDMSLFAQVEAFKRFRDRGKTISEISTILNLAGGESSKAASFTFIAKLPEPMYDLVRRGLLEIGAIIQFRRASEDGRLLIVHELGERETELGYQEMKDLVTHAESRIKDGLNVAELLGIERPEAEPAAKKEKKPARAKPRDAKALIRVIKPVVKSEEDTPLRQVCVALSLFLSGKLDHVALMDAIARNVKAEAEAFSESAAGIAA